MIRRHYVFTGDVQHVGFRWRARKAANLFHCTGWCRNEADGSVTMELQGGRIPVRLVLLAIRSSSRIRIEHTDITQITPVPEEREFRPEY